MLNPEQRREVVDYINAAPDRTERQRRKVGWYAQLNMPSPDVLRLCVEVEPPTSLDAVADQAWLQHKVYQGGGNSADRRRRRRALQHKV